MNQRIIYPNNEGGVSIIVPAQECGLTMGYNTLGMRQPCLGSCRKAFNQ